MGGDDPGDILPGRMAGARSGPGLGPRSCWQLHGERGLPGARVQWGGGPEMRSRSHRGHVRREWGRAGKGTQGQS